MMTRPQTILIMRRALSLNFALKSETIVATDVNQITDALAKPPANRKSVPAGSVALNAPSIIEPSIKACGLNQVTTQAVVMTFAIGISTFVLLSIVSCARTSPCPIQITIKLPMPKIIISKIGEVLIIAPMPKKQAMPSVISKKRIIRTVRYTRRLRCVSAVLIKNRF